jgi:alpha-ketoglutarate-dependent taurine dioxygenase
MYGDYSTIEDEDIKKTVETFNAETVKFKWQTGDIMIVDNKLSMHARNSFEPPRRILAAMCTK